MFLTARKLLISTAIILITLMGGCCKKEIETVVRPPQPDTGKMYYWRLGDSTFFPKAAYTLTEGTAWPLVVNACDDSTRPENILTIDFATLPVKGGPLRIVHDTYKTGDIRLYCSGGYGGPNGCMSVVDSASSAYITFLGNKKMYISITNALLHEFTYHDTAVMRLNAYIEVDVP